MKTRRAFLPTVTPLTAMPKNRLAGFLVMALIISVLLAACGGSAQPASQPAATGGNSNSQPAATTANGNNGNNGQDGQRGDSEFGLPEAEVTKRVDAVESLVATCMTDAGFEYIPVDYATARKAMDSNSKPSGLNADEFRAQFGYGISTQFANAATQAVMGAGEQNIRIREGLSTADRTAYMRALYGENQSATFVVGLDDENFSQTGGCTRTAIEQAFSPEELGPGFVNYQNAEGDRIDQDPRVIAAYKEWGTCMRDAGYSYSDPTEIDVDLANRLDAITSGAAPDSLSADAQAALTQLQGEELAIAAADHTCDLQYVNDIKTQVEQEILGLAPQN